MFEYAFNPCRCGLWLWEEAFMKYGFDDGNTIIHTPLVKAALAEAGYIAKIRNWGMHNVVIISIKKDGVELMPYGGTETPFMRPNPRTYLPEEIVEYLDRRFIPKSHTIMCCLRKWYYKL